MTLILLLPINLINDEMDYRNSHDKNDCFA